jgi:hypothetical protein
MNSFPEADKIIAAYQDQVEALDRLMRMRMAVRADPNSRFHGLSDDEIQDRLDQTRGELDQWVVLMLVASFEATLRADAQDRIQARTPDPVRKPLRDLHEQFPGRVRLDDILTLWEAHAIVGAMIKNNLRTLLKHRHWLAHGRHWSNKHGGMPLPLDAHGDLDDYLQALQASVPDFPRV